MKALIALAAMAVTMFALTTTAGAATAPDGRWGVIIEPSGRWGIVEPDGRWGGIGRFNVRVTAIGRW